jgi:hypothetical protein
VSAIKSWWARRRVEKWLTHPLVFNVSAQLLGYGPGLIVFWWEYKSTAFRLSWRGVELQVGRFEVVLSWA